jgi:hypothetical protein
MPDRPDLRSGNADKPTDGDSQRNAFTDIAGPIVDVYGYSYPIVYLDSHGKAIGYSYSIPDAHGATVRNFNTDSERNATATDRHGDYTTTDGDPAA